MGYTTAGLVNNGYTAHYAVSYDEALSPADGVQRANGLVAACEADFALMKGWFGGIDLVFGYPIPVQIAAGPETGASWNDPAPIEVDFGAGPTVSLQPGNGQSVALLRYLLVSEVTEMFMLTQGQGWYYPEGFFHGGDEGSKGEGLSRFLGAQFLRENNLLGGAAPPGFAVTSIWLNGPRQNFVDVNPDDNQPDPVTGCTTLFIYYLFSQLGYGIESIVAAASANLAGVYQNLTNRPAADAWPSFSGLVNSHYPPGVTYQIAGDDIFPVSDLSAFWAPNQITCGYSDSTSRIFVDSPVVGDVIIQLTSSDPAVASVPPAVTIPAGITSATVPVTAPPIAGPFDPKFVPVTATYAGQGLTMTVEVVPPAITEVTVSPDSVICGNDAVGTVFLSRPSLLGPVVASLTCAAPGFATVPATATIPVNYSQASFTITTPAIEVPFPTAHADILASYADTYAEATLTVEPSVVAGIISSLTLYPATVIGGAPSHGYVTLQQAVPTDTLVGLAALPPGVLLPGPGGGSAVASVPSSITIPAGQTTGGFQVTTKPLAPHSPAAHVSILAAAVTTKYAMLTVEGE
jgi:hypothetical protein